MADREKGTVKFFNRDKGYGFIEREGEKDIFVHKNSVRNIQSLHDGDKVEFTITKGNKGPQADDVVVLD